MGLNERLASALLTSMFLITLFCLPQTLSSLRDLSYAVGYSALAALTGLFIKISAAILGINKPSEQGEMLQEVIGKMLVRRSRFQTFTRICLWNLFVSFVIVAAGFFTIGVLPIVWAFLNLGLFSPEIDIFKRYPHSWLETIAFILSASLGIWGGANLNTLLVDFGTIPPSIIILILGLHTLAAMLETLEIHMSEHPSA